MQHITMPAIPPAVVAELEVTENVLASTKVEFVAELRARYAALASRHGGNIKVSYRNNAHTKEERFFRIDGKLAKGLLAFDSFEKDRNSRDDTSGKMTGKRVYLTADGWLQLTRAGQWSRWENSTDWWTADGTVSDNTDRDAMYQHETHEADIRMLTDRQFAESYDVVKGAETLAESLTETARKLPERLTRKRALAESLAACIAAMKGRG
jgi:hypothetical protein